jgi:hypothetical protein
VAYTDKEREQLAQLASDPRQVHVMCERHFYMGEFKKQPTKGCPDCWRAYFFKQLAETPPDRHKQFLDELEAVVKTLCYAEDRGISPVDIYKHPEVLVEHFPDEVDPKDLI